MEDLLLKAHIYLKKNIRKQLKHTFIQYEDLYNNPKVSLLVANMDFGPSIRNLYKKIKLELDLFLFLKSTY